MSLSVDQMLRKANRHAKNGEASLAEQLYKSILERYPNNKQAIDGLQGLQKLKAEEAGINAEPSQEQFNALIALYNKGKLQEAQVLGEALAKQFPNAPFIPNVLGAVNVGLGRSEQAISSFTKALRIKPDFAEAHSNLGNALYGFGKPEEAVSSFAKALQIEPDRANVHNNLGNALNDLGRPDEALPSLTRALQIKPEFAEAHNNLGNALKDLGRPEEAVASYHKALQIKPDYAEAHSNLGNALFGLGKPEEAVSSFAKALQIKPDLAEAHRNLSNFKKYQDDDPQIHQMLQLAERHDLSDDDRMHVNFALGKAYGDIGHYDKAYSHFLDGNCLRKEQLGYDISSDRTSAERIKSMFSMDVPVRNVARELDGKDGQQPVFILGMPRSGTTLVEQILASHSQVYGAGELGLLRQSVNAIKWNSTNLSSDQLQAIRKSYSSGLTKIGASEPYITDKMPDNFWLIGFILATELGTKIVHVKRDARATGWSNFKHYFSAKGNGFAYDLEDVAEYYKIYIDLMAFWHEKFPGRIYDLDYEALTEHQEDETRKLLEYVGLDWDEQCLDFHKTKRAVQTASATQVRQKMYQGSSEEWRKYEKHLEPMIELLNGF